MSASIVALERAADPAEHGGKAAALARLMAAGLPVPPGFVIGSSALERAGEIYPEVSERARRLARGRPLAVRSSAAGEDGVSASFAGQLESVLGVDPERGLASALERCRASRWSERVAAYAAARGAPLAGMGVIVQRQVDACFAGVLFTVSPEPGAEGEMLCEYCEGLGERLVAGALSPGRLSIARADGALRWQRDLESTARPQRDALSRLAAAARTAERLFGTPQDIEWALDRAGRVWLLQSRPITARSAAPGQVLWSNANVNENFPQPISPLLYSIAAPGYTRYFRGLGEAFGVPAVRLDRLEPELRSIVGVHAGRMYYNLSSIHALLRGMPFGARLARWFDDFVGAQGPAAGGGATGITELPRIAASTAWRYLFLGRRLAAFEAAVDEYAARTAPARLAGKTPLELRDDLRAFLNLRLQRWTGAALCDAAAMVCYGALKALLARALPAEHVRLHHGMLQGLDGLVSAAPVNALWELAQAIRGDRELHALFAQRPPGEVLEALPRFPRLQAQFADYLERWGFRFSGELMLTAPSFQERPSELVSILARYAAEDTPSPAARLKDQKRERLAVTREVLAALGPWRAALARPLIAATQASIGYRERARLKQALLYSRLRRVALEIGARLARERRLESPDDIFFLTASEIDEQLSGLAMFPGALAKLAELRKREHAGFTALRPADVLRAAEGEYPSTERAVEEPGAPELAGTSVCGGKVAGRARVLSEVGQARELAPGDILVTRQTDPGWAPAFVAIGGLVLERGGMLSHGAILAREYGIPTVVGVTGATARIRDGALVQIDGDRGVIAILR